VLERKVAMTRTIDLESLPKDTLPWSLTGRCQAATVDSEDRVNDEVVGGIRLVA
jgi:hypothetical protein